MQTRVLVMPHRANNEKKFDLHFNDFVRSIFYFDATDALSHPDLCMSSPYLQAF